MDKNVLETLINKGLTIEAIGDYFNCSFTNVRYWLKKYNLKTKPSKLIHNCKRCGEKNPINF